jgi:hypothetical protein
VGVSLVAVLAPLVGTAAPAGAAGTAGTAGNQSAMSLVRGMADHGVTLTHRRDEGPSAVVADGLCSHLADAGGGCVEGLISKDASLLLFDTAQHAADFAGCGDDRSDRLGRLLVSYGSPPRVGAVRQERYTAAVRRFRESHPSARTDLDRIRQALMRRGLPMRDAHADEGAARPGLATAIPGAVSMAATKQVDVVVFGAVRAAEDYAGAADDQVYRRGRVVLSFGNPALLGATRQAAYARALRRTLAATGQSASAFSTLGTSRAAAAPSTPSDIHGCGG